MDVRGEIAKADEPGEIRWAHAFLLGQFGNRRAVAAREGGVEPARPDQQLDQPCIRFGCRKRVGPFEQHLDLPPGAPQLYRCREDLSFVRRARQYRRGNIQQRAEPCRAEVDIDPLDPMSTRSISAVRKARWRVAGNSDQLFPISAARAISRRCADGSARRIA